MTHTRNTLAPLSIVALALTLTACTPLPDMTAPTLAPVAESSPWQFAPVPTTAPVAPPVQTVYVDVPGETVYVDVPGETVYVDVPTPVQYVTDQAALDAAYASGYATAEDQVNADYAGREDDAYNRGLERGGAFENQAYSVALSTPCAQEDSANCYWDAHTMGNDIGQSFVNIAGVVFYLN